MNLSQLTEYISNIIQDDAFDADVPVLINEAILKIASGDRLPGRTELTPPLPDLYAENTILTVVGESITDLPVDFNRELLQVIDTDEDSIPIEESAQKFLAQYPQIDSGDVFKCSRIGNRLFYRDVPATATTFKVQYYRKPAELTLSTDIPEGIPEYLHRKLIGGYVCKEIFNVIEDGIEGIKINTQRYEQIYQSGLLELSDNVIFDKSPETYTMDTDFCM